ncbi:MAG TPA: ABC transporter ATP-binding protein [Anaerolineae bacterium]|nr:ABC transporter ATP-binding protein [Anaerolineae bacterium]
MNNNQNQPIIQTKNLTRLYGSAIAVNNLTLTIPHGQIFGFLGPNGAGKTTTIRMLTGLLKPTSGSIHITGIDIQKDPLTVKQRIGYLAQTPLLYDKLTGHEFLLFIGSLYGLADDHSHQRATHLLELLNLTTKADQPIESYSGGMRHKIGLAAALIHQPPLLILDEPLTGLDPKSAWQVKELLRQLCDQGHTIFLSTHVLEIAEKVCDRVGILQNGTLITAGTLDTLRQQAQSSANTTLETLFLQLTEDTPAITSPGE